MLVESGSGEKVMSAADVARILSAVLSSESELDQAKEHFWVIGLTIRNQIKYIELVHLGGTATSVVDSKTVFRTAVYYAVDRIIVSHNHPSGEASPSQEDKLVTEKLKMAAKTLDIEFLDHVIVTADPKEYFGFRDNGLLG